MQCESISQLNSYILGGKIRQLIRVDESLHQMQICKIVDAIVERNAKAVLLSGPSSSGKTTTANRLATQLCVHNKKPILVSLDNYYIDRDKIIRDSNGKVDFEHINTIDTNLFEKHLHALLSGEAVRLPNFDFLTGKRVWQEDTLQLSNESVIIIEGLHALNPVLLSRALDNDKVFKIYVSPEKSLYINENEQIPPSFLRLLRRIVRDMKTRGAPVCQTISMWESVRKGEKLWIFPYKHLADACFDSATTYELAFIKKQIDPLLQDIKQDDSCYKQSCAIQLVLDQICDCDAYDEIPPTSIVREFIGGNTFYEH